MRSPPPRRQSSGQALQDNQKTPAGASRQFPPPLEWLICAERHPARPQGDRPRGTRPLTGDFSESKTSSWAANSPLQRGFGLCYWSTMTHSGTRSYRDTHKVFAETRALAHFCAARKFEKLYPRLILSNITPAALDAFRQTWKVDERHEASCHWDWSELVAQRNADPRQFQLAVWNQRDSSCGSIKDLHALAIGRTSSTGHAVRIEYIEAYPATDHPFRGSVWPIAEMALMFYGFLINAACMKVVNPLPTLVPHYRSRGFEIENKGSGKLDLIKRLGDQHGESGAEDTVPADAPAGLR